MPPEGLEPTNPFGQQLLRLSCLPISARRLVGNLPALLSQNKSRASGGFLRKAAGCCLQTFIETEGRNGLETPGHEEPAPKRKPDGGQPDATPGIGGGIWAGCGGRTGFPQKRNWQFRTEVTELPATGLANYCDYQIVDEHHNSTRIGPLLLYCPRIDLD
jgi:hypothetical protein